MKRLLLLALIPLLIFGCVSNKAFREERQDRQRLKAHWLRIIRNWVWCKEIMQDRRRGG